MKKVIVWAVAIVAVLASGALAWGAGWPGIKISLYASGLSSPTDIQSARDGSGRLFVVGRKGTVHIIKDGMVRPIPFLDVSGLIATRGAEQGLLGLAFPPSYASKRYFYVDYTRASDGAVVVARYRVSASDLNLADPASGEVIFTQAKPYRNHNGGQIVFGPDGYLYIGIGDGGSGGDPHRNGQNPRVLLGKLLRIDTEGGKKPYGIPPGNPYGTEVWAIGLRNPWRYSFDRDALYIADVGQDTYEEIDYQPSNKSAAGANYGWNIMEGASCFGAPACDRTGLVMPVTTYDHSAGDCSVTGGYAYTGKDFPALDGIYLFGDFCSGRIRGLRREGGEWRSAVLLESHLAISTFGLDERGEIYVADYSSGKIYRIGTR